MASKSVQKYGFDVEGAIESLEALYALGGLDVTLYSPVQNEQGDQDLVVHFDTKGCSRCCPRCLKRDGLLVWSSECLKSHLSAGMLADRHGGKYVYVCPENKIFISAPVVNKRVLRGVMLVGPADVSEDDDILTCYEGFEPFRLRDSETLHHLTTLTASIAAGVGDGMESYLRRVSKDDRFSSESLEKSIMKTKRSRSTEYPIASEQTLCNAVRNADSAAALSALDRIFSYFFTYAVNRGDYMSYEQSSELVVIISRAALEAGVDSNIVFSASSQCKKELAYTSNHIQAYRRVRFFIEEVIGFVKALQNLSFDDQIYRVQSYIQSHLTEEIRLDQVGEAVGLSPSYLSRVFKEKTGLNFVEYVNQMRIETAKADLLTSNFTITEIAQRCGFESVSYFTRVFKKMVGMPPGSYRKSRGQSSETL